MSGKRKGDSTDPTIIKEKQPRREQELPPATTVHNENQLGVTEHTFDEKKTYKPNETVHERDDETKEHTFPSLKATTNNSETTALFAQVPSISSSTAEEPPTNGLTNTQTLETIELIRRALESFKNLNTEHENKVAAATDHDLLLLSPEILEELQEQIMTIESKLTTLTHEWIETKEEWKSNLRSVHSTIESAGVEIEWTNAALRASIQTIEKLEGLSEIQTEALHTVQQQLQELETLVTFQRT